MDVRIEKAANAISDKHRLAILLEVAKKGHGTCGLIGELTGLSQPAVSHHIKILVDAGVLVYDKCGRQVQLTVNKEMMSYLSRFFNQLC